MTDDELLIAEYVSDPLGRGYARMTIDELWKSLSKQDRFDTRPRRVDERIVLAEFPGGPAAGEALLQKLETAAAGNPVLGRSVRWFRPSEGGIDVGHTATRGMLDSLVGVSGITQDEVSKLKALAKVKVSRLEELLLTSIGRDYMRYLIEDYRNSVAPN